MNTFSAGEKYKLCFASSNGTNGYGQEAGYVEILSVKRFQESEIILKETGVHGCFGADAGEIEFIVYSESTNAKKKKAVLKRSVDSQEWADKYCKGIRAHEWFSPTKRNYQSITAVEDLLN